MHRLRAATTLAAVTLIAGACPGRPLFERETPLVERRNSSIVPSEFHVLGTIAGGGSRYERRISATIRQQLADSGLIVKATPGTWESQTLAVRGVCAPESVPAVDGVLFVWYNRLQLFDCDTQAAAYEISGGGLGINQMADRLVAYLKRTRSTESAER